jgi:hypothetical protein
MKKTQKEIYEEHLKEFPDSKRTFEFIIRERQEIIKHIKFLIKEQNNIVYDEHILSGKINVLKEFFDITEVELRK